jgi:fibronectin type 3 domain-containing protein
LEDGKTYSYLIIAVDGNKLESKPAGPVSMTIALNAQPKKVEKFAARFDQKVLTVNLSWKAEPAVKGYQIYKDDSDGQNFYLLSFIEATENKLTDTEIKPFKTYSYKIRSVSEKGLYSPFEMVKVAWK